MTNIFVVGTNTLVEIGAKNLFLRGEITADQYTEIQRRNQQLPAEYQKDVVIV